jgi:hypothetical protein
VTTGSAPVVIGRRAAFDRGTQSSSYRATRAPSRLPAILALLGLIVPSGLQLTLGGAKLTLGRIGLVFLLLPAFARLFRPGRRALLSDLLASIIAIWMIGAPTYAAGLDSMVSGTAECFDFVGGYIVARGFFCDLAALDQFVRVLKMFASIAIVLALAEVISSHWIVRDVVTIIMRDPTLSFAENAFPVDALRGNFLRAMSTFDHPILFGVFCALTAAILIYWEKTGLRQILWGGFCFLGCLASQSSGAAMGIFIVMLTYFYDRTMKSILWRWTLLWSVLLLLVFAVFAISSNPLSWILSHATFDPQTGFYRMLIWEAASDRISQNPITGAGFALFGDYLLDRTVDSVWLVLALRYGLTMVVLLIFFNVSSFLPTRPISIKPAPELDRLRTVFTLVLVTFMFTGLTVHFWNYMWTFWGLCIGIRASLREQAIFG